MMKSFQEMLVDLEELRGLPLNSISGQATPFRIEKLIVKMIGFC